jgi:hypothetical protein
MPGCAVSACDGRATSIESGALMPTSTSATTSSGAPVPRPSRWTTRGRGGSGAAVVPGTVTFRSQAGRLRAAPDGRQRADSADRQHPTVRTSSRAMPTVAGQEHGRSGGSSGDRLFHTETASHPGARPGDEERVVDPDAEADEDGSGNVATVVQSGDQPRACPVRAAGGAYPAGTSGSCGPGAADGSPCEEVAGTR